MPPQLSTELSVAGRKTLLLSYAGCTMGPFLAAVVLMIPRDLGINNSLNDCLSRWNKNNDQLSNHIIRNESSTNNKSDLRDY